MANQQIVAEVDAATFLRVARKFYAASERVFDPEELTNLPLHFLYAHVLELCFKAFLRVHNVPTSDLKRGMGHHLDELYEKCRSFGLVIGTHDRTDIGNVVNMLETANDEQGLRYSNPDVKMWPSLSWTRSVVQELLSAVAVRLGIPAAEIPGPAVGFTFVLSEPTYE